MAAKAKVTPKSDVIGHTVPIEWNMPEGTKTPFASNIVVQLTEDVFKISFFEVKIPIITDKSTPPPSKLRADCVASVFVSPKKLPKLIEILKKHYEAYLQIKEDA